MRASVRLGTGRFPVFWGVSFFGIGGAFQNFWAKFCAHGMGDGGCPFPPLPPRGRLEHGGRGQRGRSWSMGGGPLRRRGGIEDRRGQRGQPLAGHGCRSFARVLNRSPSRSRSVSRSSSSRRARRNAFLDSGVTSGVTELPESCNPLSRICLEPDAASFPSWMSRVRTPCPAPFSFNTRFFGRGLCGGVLDFLVFVVFAARGVGWI